MGYAILLVLLSGALYRAANAVQTHAVSQLAKAVRQ